MLPDEPGQGGNERGGGRKAETLATTMVRSSNLYENTYN